jgi:ferredoxin
MASSTLPYVDIDKCAGCGQCYEVCPSGAIQLVDNEERFQLDCKSTRRYLRERDQHIARIAGLTKGDGQHNKG